MSAWGTPIRLLSLSALFFVAFPFHGTAQWLTTPQPGDIWKEYVRFISTSNDNFRVTDPNTTNATAQTFLPNDRLSYAVNDLQGMTRAEIVLDTWGGHCGTTGQEIPLQQRTLDYHP